MQTSEELSSTAMELSGSELARRIRVEYEDADKPENLCTEALARLVEADTRNHDMLASEAMRWRGLLERCRDVMGMANGAGELSPGQWDEFNIVLDDVEAALRPS